MRSGVGKSKNFTVFTKIAIGGCAIGKVPHRQLFPRKGEQSLSIIPDIRLILLFADIMNEISASNGSWLKTRMPDEPGEAYLKLSSAASAASTAE